MHPVPLQHFNTGKSLVFNPIAASIVPVDPESILEATPSLGFASEVPTENGPSWIAYWADQRHSLEEAPLYGRGLNVLLAGEVFHIIPEPATCRLREGLTQRTIELTQGSKVVQVTYRWPIFREALSRMLGDPFTFTSTDIAYELAGVVNFYASSRTEA